MYAAQCFCVCVIDVILIALSCFNHYHRFYLFMGSGNPSLKHRRSQDSEWGKGANQKLHARRHQKFLKEDFFARQRCRKMEDKKP